MPENEGAAGGGNKQVNQDRNNVFQSLADAFGVDLKVLLGDIEGIHNQVHSRATAADGDFRTSIHQHTIGILSDAREHANRLFADSNSAANIIMHNAATAAGVLQMNAVTAFGRQANNLTNPIEDASANALLLQWSQLNADSQKSLGAVIAQMAQMSNVQQTALGGALLAITTDLAKKATATPAGGATTVSAQAGDAKAAAGAPAA